MKRLIPTIAAIAVIAVTQAQTSLAWEFNTRTRDWTPVVAQRVKTLESVPLVRSLDFSMIAGLQGGSGAPSLGIMVSRSFTLAKGVEGVFGVTGRYVQNRPPQFMGLVIGVRF